jgi:hypothetical protein
LQDFNKFIFNTGFFTPPSSPELIQEDSDDDMKNAEEEGFVVFIEG